MKWIVGLVLAATSVVGHAAVNEVGVEAVVEGLQKNQAVVDKAAYDQMFRNCTARYNGDVRGQSSNVTLLGENRVRVRWAAWCAIKRPTVYGVARSTSLVEVHGLAGDASYTNFKLHAQTALGEVGTSLRSQFQFADYDNDGVDDLFLFSRQGTGTGKTELHVLRGPEYKTFLMQTGTALAETGSDNAWKFLVGDYNVDGRLDIYAISKSGLSGTVEVHVLDGSAGYQSFLLNTTTATGATGTSTEVDYGIGDYNNDGVIDLYSIIKNGSSGKTEVHVLDGASKFQKFIGHHATGMPMTGSGQAWSFGVGDYNFDGIPDLYVMSKDGIYSQVHIWNGATAFSTALLHTATPFATDGKSEQHDMLLGRAKR
ncbi:MULTISPECIES: FG-GAP repeat domain-containing protein [Xanthomonas]|uniref:FG-GAP repeat domain-containing protein n=1 Tax=Xanthomonas TaxID=338 RepID=UPI000E1F0A85|nr:MULTISPECIES: VCBS repeat-containing protein [Xanthomonas]